MTLWYFANLLFLKNPYNPLSGLKVRVLRMFGARIGRGVVVKPSVSVKYPWLLEVGDNTWIGEEVWIDNLAMVSIGSNCCLSQGAMLLCGNHDYRKPTFDLMVGEITLRNGAWIGARATVCPGVTVGEEAVLSVGSVATGDLQPNTIYQGTPAEPVRIRHL